MNYTLKTANVLVGKVQLKLIIFSPQFSTQTAGHASIHIRY